MGFNLKFGLWDRGKLEYILGCVHERTVVSPTEEGSHIILISVYAKRVSENWFGGKYKFYARGISLSGGRTFFRKKLFEHRDAAKFLIEHRGAYLDQILETMEFCALSFPY